MVLHDHGKMKCEGVFPRRSGDAAAALVSDSLLICAVRPVQMFLQRVQDKTVFAHFRYERNLSTFDTERLPPLFVGPPYKTSSITFQCGGARRRVSTCRLDDRHERESTRLLSDSLAVPPQSQWLSGFVSSRLSAAMLYVQNKIIFTKRISAHCIPRRLRNDTHPAGHRQEAKL